jgi:single-strand DNA-binding protein
MPTLNLVHLIGNVTRDPEIKYTPKGTPLVEIDVGINRVWKDDNDEKHQEVTFVPVRLWARLAEIAAQYIKKGRPILIEGRLEIQNWQDRETGKNRSRMVVIAENLQLLGERPAAAKPAGGAGPRRDPGEEDDIPYRSTIWRDIRGSRLSQRLIV